MTDQGSTAASQPPLAPPAAEQPGRSTLSRRVQIGVATAIMLVFGIILISRLITWNDLPGCDSTRAKDTLSSIFKERNVNASRYDEIKTLTTGKDEITCNATLTLRDDSKLMIDYKLYRGDSGVRLLITRSNP